MPYRGARTNKVETFSNYDYVKGNNGVFRGAPAHRAGRRRGGGLRISGAAKRPVRSKRLDAGAASRGSGVRRRCAAASASTFSRLSAPSQVGEVTSHITYVHHKTRVYRSRTFGPNRSKLIRCLNSVTL